MSKKFLIILSALLIAASLSACNNEGEKDPNETIKNNNQFTEKESSTEEQETDESGSQVTPPENIEGKTPGEYSYEEASGKVYILHENGAVNLRNADGTVFRSFSNNTEFERVGISDDGDWTKVKYENVEYYVVSDCLTDLADCDAGFVDAEKTLTLATAGLSIRIAPSMNNRIVGYYSEGDEVKVIKENTATGWYKVEFTAYGGATAIGYVASDAKYYANDEETSSSTEATTEDESTTSATE